MVPHVQPLCVYVLMSCCTVVHVLCVALALVEVLWWSHAWIRRIPPTYR